MRADVRRMAFAFFEQVAHPMSRKIDVMRRRLTAVSSDTNMSPFAKRQVLSTVTQVHVPAHVLSTCTCMHACMCSR